MMRQIQRAFAVLAMLMANSGAATEDVQWVRVTALLEPGSGETVRVEQTVVPGGVYSLAEVDRRGIEAIDDEILRRTEFLSEKMHDVEGAMRLATVLARQYYLPLEVGKKAVLPVIDLNPRLGMVFTPKHTADGRMDCRVQFLEPEGQPSSPEFTGKPITLRLRDANLQDVLRTFSKLTQVEIMVDPSISAKVTVDLREIPWDEALDLMLRVNSLGWKKEGDALRVAPLDEMSSRKRVRTDATVRFSRDSSSSWSVASEGDEYNPTVVLNVEPVDGAPDLVAERDGLVHVIRAVLVDVSRAELSDSIGDLAVFRATVTVDGRLKDPEVLASPSPEYAEKFAAALEGWRFRSAMNEEGRRHEAVVGFGVRLGAQRVLASIGDVEHIGVEITGKSVEDHDGIYVVTAIVTDLDTGEVISMPRVTAMKGSEANLSTGFIAPSGKPTTVEMSFLVSEDGKVMRYSWTLTRDGKVLNSHKAEFGL